MPLYFKVDRDINPTMQQQHQHRLQIIILIILTPPLHFVEGVIQPIMEYLHLKLLEQIIIKMLQIAIGKKHPVIIYQPLLKRPNKLFHRYHPVHGIDYEKDLEKVMNMIPLIIILRVMFTNIILITPIMTITDGRHLAIKNLIDEILP